MADARDKLDGVTRPRPSIGPALAGAVDLSGLKQQSPADRFGGWPAAGGGPAGSAGWYGDHRGQLRKRSAGPVRRSAGGGGVVVTAQRGVRRARRHAGRPGRRRQRHVVAGDGQRRRDAQGGPDIRRRGGPDRGGFGCGTTDVELPGRPARGSIAPLAGLDALGDGRQAKGPKRFRGTGGSRSRAGAARQHLEDGDFAAAKQSYQEILDANPGSVEAKGAIRQIDFLTRATAQRPDAVAVADAAPGGYRGRVRGRRCANPQPGCERGVRAA